MLEEWRLAVKAYSHVSKINIKYSHPNIYVSNLGSIKLDDQVISPTVDGGYFVFYTHGKTFAVHRLVCLAFIGECPQGLRVRHLDGNSKNNRVDNLCYGTAKENTQDAIRHGTLKPNPLPCHRGSKHAKSVLTEELVIKLRKMAAYNTQRDLAKIFNVSLYCVNAVINRVTWRHI